MLAKLIKRKYSLFSPKKKEAIVAEQILSTMSKDSVWFYSQVKSGTTYTIIFVINYLNELQGKNLSKEDIFNKLPYFHSFEKRIKSYSSSKIREEQKVLLEELNIGFFLHTHIYINDFSNKRILITRNPLDFIISSYFFYYINRGQKVSLNKVWKKILKRFILNHKKQVEIYKNQPHTTLSLQYEKLVKDPEREFGKLVNFLELSFNANILHTAINKSQKKEVKKLEGAGGAAIIAGKAYKSNSFIRSGKIGEWKEHIDSSFKEQIFNFLKKEGVDINLFIYE